MECAAYTNVMSYVYCGSQLWTALLNRMMRFLADSAEVNPATLPQYHISGDLHLNLNDITSGVIDLGNNNGNGISDDDAKQ